MSRRPPAYRGFTLVEMMVAIALLSIMSVFLVSMTNSISTIWQQGIAHSERRSIALALFSRIGRDLRNASLPADIAASNRLPADDPNKDATLQFVINPAGLEAYEMPQAAFWQAPSASDRKKGDLGVVGYFVQWVDEKDQQIPKLCRLLINPSRGDADNADYKIQPGPPQWISQAIIANNASASSQDPQGAYRGQLAENVLGLWIRALDQKSQPITSDALGQPYSNGSFDSRRGYRSSNGRTYTNALPACIEVAIVTIDSRTAKRLHGNEKPHAETGDFWADIHDFYDGLPDQVKHGARIYSSVIELANAPR
jgi:prepilin-type N-terminal cleavage/methylation domain-containing protein